MLSSFFLLWSARTQDRILIIVAETCSVSYSVVYFGGSSIGCWEEHGFFCVWMKCFVCFLAPFDWWYYYSPCFYVQFLSHILSIGKSGVLKSPTVTVVWLICGFSSNSVSFMTFGTTPEVDFLPPYGCVHIYMCTCTHSTHTHTAIWRLWVFRELTWALVNLWLLHPHLVERPGVGPREIKECTDAHTVSKWCSDASHPRHWLRY